MKRCLTREISPLLNECQLTHLDRRVIDVDLARLQHSAYEDAMRRLGLTLERLPPTPGLADGVFVEDTALVLPELAVIMRPGAASRRRETDSVSAVLARHREVRFIGSPGTIEGGDVLAVGRTLFVGLSTRTNRSGVEQLAAATAEFGYHVRAVEVKGCLHLKSAATQVASDLLLMNPKWLGAMPVEGMRTVDAHPDEPAAANALWVGDSVVFPEGFPGTADRLASNGVRLVTVDLSEIQKAEGGVTCCSLIFSDRGQE